MSDAPRLRMRGVRKSFGGVHALRGVDLEVAPGEAHALIGENGAGKSTLMKILSGALAADAGSMELDGAAYAPAGPAGARSAGVAMIYQELNLAPHLSVAENVFLGREPRRGGLRLDRAAMGAEVGRAFALLAHGNIHPDARVAELGPGPRQLVEVARALIGRARVIVMDEPTSSLARSDVARLFAVVSRLKTEGVSVIYISHFLEEVREVADRFTVLRDGETVGLGAVAAVPTAEIIRMMVGRELEEAYPRVPHARGEPILEAHALAGAGGPRGDLPRAASFTLHRGEIFGIAGLVGAGRTELLRALHGLDPVRSGAVRLCCVPPPRVGLLSEDRKLEGLALALPIADNVTLSHLGPLTRWGRLDRRAQAAAAARWSAELGIKCTGPAQLAGALSGGNQQKVAFARLLHEQADVLLLDEPTRGVDVGSKAEIYRLMGRLAAQGKALLVVSSYLPELLGVCDRIAVMHRGVLGPARAASGWTAAALLDAATRGEAA
jgi:ribose transport system ATP-binding protein